MPRLPPTDLSFLDLSLPLLAEPAPDSIERSGSQLVTLSYRDGTALPAPAPLEAAPVAAPWGAADGMLPAAATAAADGAATNGGSGGGSVPRKLSGGALLPPAASWGRRDSGVDGGSEGGGRDSYDGSSGSEEGGGGGDAASVASSRAGLLAGNGEGHGEGGRPRNVWEVVQDQLTMGECIKRHGVSGQPGQGPADDG